MCKPSRGELGPRVEVNPGWASSVVGTSPTLSLTGLYNPSLQVSWPCLTGNRQLGETEASGHPRAICPSAPSLELGRAILNGLSKAAGVSQPILSLAFLSPSVRLGGCKESGVNVSRGWGWSLGSMSSGPFCGRWSPASGEGSVQCGLGSTVNSLWGFSLAPF